MRSNLRNNLCIIILVVMISTVITVHVPNNTSAQVTEEWVARYNGPGNDVDTAHAIALDEDSGQIYVTGGSYGSGPFKDFSTIAYDLFGNELWVARYNGPANKDDVAWDITTDSSGNVYVTGYGSSSVGASVDYITIGYDSYGNEIWLESYNGPGNNADNARAIIVDLSNNIYVTGSSYGSGTGHDFATIAYDLFGNELWVARYNGPGNERDLAQDIAVDSLGNIYITGGSDGSGTGRDYATVAYDTSGNELWVARYDGPGNGNDHPQAIAVDSSGNIYVTGTSTGIGSDYDFATVAYDSSGNELWVKRYDSPGDDWDCSNDIALDPLGNVYVTGYSYITSTDVDYTTIAYDSFGNELWIEFYNGPASENDAAQAITIDNIGNVYITGFSKGSGTLLDSATVAYDSSGNELWVKRYNDPNNSNDYSYAIVVDSSGNVYVTGYAGGNWLDPSLWKYYDYVTIKYSQNFPNQPPVADVKPEMLFYEGDSILFDGSASYDPDGLLVNYSWEFGDGNFGYGVSVSHIYLKHGVYNVNLTVIDENGASDSDTCVVTILPEIISPIIDIDPDTLNLKSKGRWITCYIDLPDVSEIDIGTILLEDTIPAEWGDIQGDILMVKFDRSEVEDMLVPGSYNLKVTGELLDGTGFEGYSDEVRVIGPPK